MRLTIAIIASSRNLKVDKTAAVISGCFKKKRVHGRENTYTRALTHGRIHMHARIHERMHAHTHYERIL